MWKPSTGKQASEKIAVVKRHNDHSYVLLASGSRVFATRHHRTTNIAKHNVSQQPKARQGWVQCSRKVAGQVVVWQVKDEG